MPSGAFFLLGYDYLQHSETQKWKGRCAMSYLKTIGSQFVRLIIPIIFSLVLLISFSAGAQEGTLKWSIDIGVEG